MLMNLTAFICFAIVIGVMAAMKVYSDRSGKSTDPAEKQKKKF